MSSPEINFDRVPLLSPSDAEHLGRLAALGFALPTDEELRTVAQPVTEADLDTPVLQRQVERLTATAYGIGKIPRVNFGGVAMTQLTLDPELERPFDLVVVAHHPNLPGEPDLVTKFNDKKDIPFRILANLAFELGPERFINIEGCHSLANICVMAERATTIQKVSALSLHDGIVEADSIGGFAALSFQHEERHERAELSGDASGTIRLVVERDPKSPISIDEYRRRRKPSEFDDWQPRISDQGWRRIFKEPGYDLFPTQRLKDAFEEGRQDQLRRLAA